MYEKMKEEGVYPCQGAVLDLGDDDDDDDDGTSAASDGKALSWILAVATAFFALVML